MNISEKAAFIKGLLEGMDYDKSTKEGKLFAAIADLLEDLSLSVLDLEDEAAGLADYAEELDEDLGELERFVYDFDGDEDYYDYDDCDDCVDLECPACGEIICLDYDEVEDNDTVVCPYCDNTLTVSKEEEDYEDDEEE